MANYLLVHGGDRDGSIWEEVAKPLKADGHQVFCPTMTPVTEVTVQKNVEEIVDAINSNNLEDVILIGHSYGGMVITGVTDKLPEKIRMLGYVDSFIPESGNSLVELCESVGFDYLGHGLTADPGVMSKLEFNEKVVFARPKFYLLCLNGEFLAVTRPVYERIKNSNEDWLTFALDSKHAVMLIKPRELAVIFSGVNAILTSK